MTGVTPGADRVTLAHATSGGGNNFDNGATVTTLTGDTMPATLSVLGRSYGRAATVGVVETTIFFIAPSTQANDAGENIMSLWRKVGPAAPVELVQGVDNMQIFYGVDTTLDGLPNVNRYQTIDAVADVNSVVAIRVRIDVRSPDALAENNNQPLRRTFTKTISIRNQAV